jgi:hypothetical protein
MPRKAEVGRVLGLRVDAHAGALGEVDDLLEGRDELGAVEDGVGRPHVGQALLGPQGPQLGQGEVLGEPAGDPRAVHGLGGAAVGELGVAGHVGGGGDVVLVSGHELVVLGGHQVGLDVVGAHLDGELVGGEGVLRPVAGAAAVTDHQREPLAHVLAGRGLASGSASRDARARQQREQRRGECRCDPTSHGTTPLSSGFA